MQMLNVVIPMAGLGSRFANARYSKPKPFIDVLGKPMIIRVLENLLLENANYILIAQEKHLLQEKAIVAEIKKQFNVNFIGINSLTQGTACTILHAKEHINTNAPLLIANSDQLVDIAIKDFIKDSQERNLDGSILTFIDTEKNPKWSFAKIENSLVKEVREKEAISKYATIGIYLFSKGSDFVNAAEAMIKNNDKVNNEFYTCPTYNYLIKNGAKVGIFNIDSTKMHGIGTPEDLEAYLHLKGYYKNNNLIKDNL